MTFLGANKLKLSQHIFTCLDNRTQASSLSIVQLNSTIYTQQNYFNYTPTVNTSTDRITLPAGCSSFRAVNKYCQFGGQPVRQSVQS